MNKKRIMKVSILIVLLKFELKLQDKMTNQITTVKSSQQKKRKKIIVLRMKVITQTISLMNWIIQEMVMKKMGKKNQKLKLIKKENKIKRKM